VIIDPAKLEPATAETELGRKGSPCYSIRFAANNAARIKSVSLGAASRAKVQPVTQTGRRL